MATKYVGENALTQILTLIKNNFIQKTLKTGSSTNYKELTDNNLSDDMKSHYDAAYTHSQAAHAPIDAQANVIEAIKVNGTAQTITEKAVDIAVPLISTDVSADSGTDLKAVSPKAVKSYVTSAVSGITGMDFRILTSGEYDADTGVPTVEGAKGTIYLVPLTTTSGAECYSEYIYVNNAFEHIGSTNVDLSGYLKTTDIAGYTAEEVNSIWTTVFSV